MADEQGPWSDYQGAGGPWDDYSGFTTVINPLLKREGGYVNDPDDRGGETKFGISKRAHPGVDIASLTQDKAKEIYRQKYWDAIDADKLDPAVREIAFDAAVHHGVGWWKENATTDPEQLILKRKAHYEAIVHNDPSQQKFMKGWMNRLSELAPPWMELGGSK